VSDIPWAGSVELEPEVEEWLQGLSPEDFATVETYINLLAEVGPLLDEPHTRQLSASFGSCDSGSQASRGGSPT
jgi:hypothetical protein